MEHARKREDWSAADWERVAEQRSRFLATTEEEGSGWGSAWHDERDLELYDQSFGERIRWKWEAVLGELAARGWSPPGGHVHDFAAGTAVALRALLAAFGTSSCKRATLWDRSPLAREYARAKLASEHAGIRADDEAPGARGRIDLLHVSHVLGELDDDGWRALRGEVARSRAVIFVEPGSKEVSRALGRFREELAPSFAAVAPCPHGGECGAMAESAAGDWCHFFARVPQEAFSERRWTLFAQRLGIDLRSLTYSYLVLERRAALHAWSQEGYARLIGRPRIEKGRAGLFVCEESGLSRGRYLEREDRAFFKRLRAPLEPSLVELVREGERIRSVTPRMPSLERAPESSLALTPDDVAELGEGRALVFDCVLGEARARAIAEALSARASELRPAAVGNGSERKLEPAIRGDSIAWLERETEGPLVPLWRLFDGLRAELAQRAWLGLDDCEVQLAQYEPGASYSRHLDAFARGGRRRVSVIYYLNEWRTGDGGELCVHEADGTRRIAPELDRLVLFLSEKVEHEVADTRSTRLAVTAWMLGP